MSSLFLKDSLPDREFSIERFFPLFQRFEGHWLLSSKISAEKLADNFEDALYVMSHFLSYCFQELLFVFGVGHIYYSVSQ